MTAIAGWIYLACTLFYCLPGVRTYRGRPGIDWSNPGPYVSITAFGAAIYLSIVSVL